MSALKPELKPTGSFDIFKKISGDQGITAFWRGNMAGVYKNFLRLSINILFYDRVKKWWLPKGDDKYSGFDNAWRRLTAGLIAGSFTLMGSYPLEVIQTRLITDMSLKGKPRVQKTCFDAFSLLQVEGGYKALYKGFTISAITMLPQTALLFPVYELLKSYAPEGITNGIGAGTLAGLLVSTLIYPLDSVKRMMQVSGS